LICIKDALLASIQDTKKTQNKKHQIESEVKSHLLPVSVYETNSGHWNRWTLIVTSSVTGHGHLQRNYRHLESLVAIYFGQDLVKRNSIER